MSNERTEEWKLRALDIVRSIISTKYDVTWAFATRSIEIFLNGHVLAQFAVSPDTSHTDVHTWAEEIVEQLDSFSTVFGPMRLKHGASLGFAPRPAAHRPATIFLPSELDSIRPDIIRHLDAMIYKLRKNSNKGSIQEWDLEKAFLKLEEEVKELRQAIDEGSPVEIVMESADCSNMALILAAIGLKKIQHV